MFFDLETWSFCFLHKNLPAIYEFLGSLEDTQNRQYSNSDFCSIAYLKSDLIDIDKGKMFEYHPLLTSRAHNFANRQKSKILNV